MSATAERSALRRDLHRDGAARLLRELVRQGLPHYALPRAARLVVDLDRVAAERREQGRAA